MFLPQPHLDDTRWADLVDESRGLLPFYAGEWTDHNASDPGMTFIDLLAWIAEQQVFQLDQVPAAHRLAFLALAGVRPRGPRPARTVLGFAVEGAPVEIPAGTECGSAAGFRTLHALTAVPGAVAGLACVDVDGSALDLTARWRRGEPVAPFGDDPRPGCALTITLTEAAPAGATVTLGTATPDGRGEQVPDTHHDAVVRWDVQSAVGAWVAADVVVDDTRSLTRDGRVVLRLPEEPLGPALRARHAAGAFDAAPWLRELVLNGVEAEQAVALTGAWTLGPDVAAPPVGAMHLGVELDASGAIVALDAGDEAAPVVDVLASEPGQLTLAARRLGRATGDPAQRLEIPSAPVDLRSIHLFAGHGSQWRHYTARPDLRASGPDDAHVLLDATTGRVTFGDGARGRLPHAGDLVVAIGHTTLADRGNVPAGTVDTLAAPEGVTVAQPLVAAGGSAAETLRAAESRAAALVDAPTRAVTLADTEALALDTPGTRIARVSALGDRHPAFPCVRAAGIVTVVVVPHLPRDRPTPSPGLTRAVARHLCPRRIVGTRIEVTGPTYVSVTIRATVTSPRRVNAADVRAAVATALDTLLDPLRGGPAGTGWPFGRDVVRSEILQVVDDVAGVDHVVTLDLIGPDGASCGNLCLGPLELVDPGEHEIAVVIA